MGEVLVADEADHAVELFVGRGFELPGDVGDAVRVVACVADRKRLFAQLLPAAHERGVGCRVARTFEEGAAGDGQRRLLVQEIDRCGCRDHVAALVVAPQIEIDLEVAVVAGAVHAEVLAVGSAEAGLARELLLGVDDLRLVGGGGLLDDLVVAGIALADDYRNALF